MSALHVYILCCNAPECAATFTVHEHRADMTRCRASLQGWTYGIDQPNPRKGNAGPTKSYDYCPVHADMIGDRKPRNLPVHAVPEAVDRR